MNILVVDYISYASHQNFNKIHFDALLTMGHKLDFVGRQGQFYNMDEEHKGRTYVIPEIYYERGILSPITERLQGIFALGWVKQNVRLSLYDMIIFPTYDVMSLWTFRTKIPVVVINHNNVSQLTDNIAGRIKFFLTKKLPKSFVHVCLNEDMTDRMRALLPKRKVFHVPHGILRANTLIVRPAFIEVDERFIFCPVNRNVDQNFVATLFSSKQLYDYLENTKTKLYVKSNIADIQAHDYVHTIKSFLSKQEYDYMMQNAFAVVLPYGSEFKYRCSGMFFECVAHNIPVVSTNINAMRIYKDITNISFFTTPDELVESLSSIDAKKVYDKAVFNPMAYWNELFSKIM